MRSEKEEMKRREKEEGREMGISRNDEWVSDRLFLEGRGTVFGGFR